MGCAINLYFLWKCSLHIVVSKQDDLGTQYKKKYNYARKSACLSSERITNSLKWGSWRISRGRKRWEGEERPQALGAWGWRPTDVNFARWIRKLRSQLRKRGDWHGQRYPLVYSQQWTAALALLSVEQDWGVEDGCILYKWSERNLASVAGDKLPISWLSTCIFAAGGHFGMECYLPHITFASGEIRDVP